MLGISACSGGGGGGSSEPESTTIVPSGTAPVSQASDIVITPLVKPAPQPEVSTPAQTAVQQTVINPPAQEPALTGIRLTTTRKYRKLNLRMTLVPPDADWTWINFDIDPEEAGDICCYTKSGDNFFYTLECEPGYSGDVTFTTIVSQGNGPDVQRSFSFTCQ